MIQLIPADYRRGSAIVCHWASECDEGFNGISMEAAQAQRLSHTILAMLHVYETNMRVYYSEQGIKAVWLQMFRFGLSADPDLVQAAKIIAGWWSRDIDAINAVIIHAETEQRAAELLIRIMECHNMVCPLLHTEEGLAALRMTVAKAAGLEEQEDQQ